MMLRYVMGAMTLFCNYICCHFGVASSNLLLAAAGKTFRISWRDSTFHFQVWCEEVRFSFSNRSLFLSFQFFRLSALTFIKYRFLYCFSFFSYSTPFIAYIKYDLDGIQRIIWWSLSPQETVQMYAHIMCWVLQKNKWREKRIKRKSFNILQ